MTLEHEELTSKVIAAAIEVHRQLGPGFIESIYEHALVVELRNRGLKVEQQVEVPVEYEGVEVGRHRLDLFVEGTIVVELKAIKNLENVHCHCKVVSESSWEGAWIAVELCKAYARGKEGDMSKSQIISWFLGFLIVQKPLALSG